MARFTEKNGSLLGTLSDGPGGPLLMTSRRTREPYDRNLAHARVRATVDSIPRGKVATYGQVALEAGLPGRARMVGRLMRELPRGSGLPWHRVVNAAGKSSLDPRSRSGREQLARLEREGVEVSASGRIDLALHGWRPT